MKEILKLIFSAVLGFFLAAITAGILEQIGFDNIGLGSVLSLVLIGIWGGISYYGLSDWLDKKISKPQDLETNIEETGKEDVTYKTRTVDNGSFIINEMDVPIENPEEEKPQNDPPTPNQGKRANNI